jgi:beta-lactam-binding protein with PASTA domain
LAETNRALSALSRVGLIGGIIVTFILGLTGTVYLSLRSSEVRVPDVLGKNYLAGEEALNGASLNIRKRASRYSANTKPDTILDQSPRAGEFVKAGQTIAVVVSRPPKEGETPPPAEVDEAKAGANKAIEATNANNNSSAKNQNGNKDQKSGKDTRNKNSNLKSNSNANRNANNRNTNNSNANNSNRNLNNRNANNRSVNLNGNRNSNNLNLNRRAPVNQTPRINPTTGNTRTP